MTTRDPDVTELVIRKALLPTGVSGLAIDVVTEVVKQLSPGRRIDLSRAIRLVNDQTMAAATIEVEDIGIDEIATAAFAIAEANRHNTGEGNG